MNLDDGKARVRHQLLRIGGQFVLTEPKSESSRRTLMLPLPGTASLVTHSRSQDAEKAAAQAWLNAWSLAFTGAHGEPLEAKALLRAFYGHLEAAGLPKIRFHDLRHTAITRLKAAGVHVKLAQAIAGHSSVCTTLDIYTHATPPSRSRPGRRWRS